MNKNNKLKFKLSQHRIKRSILNQTKKNKGIIFGGRAIGKKLGINARKTKDFDIFVKKPKSEAKITDNKLDKVLRSNSFFVKKGQNPTTYKVKFKGGDAKANTKDDVGVVDYTKTPTPSPKTFTSNGVRYRTLKEELNAKKRLIKNKDFEFRRKKDLEDFIRIKRFGRRFLK